MKKNFGIPQNDRGRGENRGVLGVEAESRIEKRRFRGNRQRRRGSEQVAGGGRETPSSLNPRLVILSVADCQGGETKNLMKTSGARPRLIKNKN